MGNNTIEAKEKKNILESIEQASWNSLRNIQVKQNISQPQLEKAELLLRIISLSQSIKKDVRGKARAFSA